MQLSIIAAPGFEAHADRWSHQLRIPVVTDPKTMGILRVSENGLCLEENLPGGLHFGIDFIAGRMGYRRQALQQEPFVTVLGLKKRPGPLVLDLTAGWGSDTFIMAALGCTVVAIEQHPVVFAMLDDALSRAKAHPELAEIVSRITLIHTTAQIYLDNLSASPDIIYYDPMFPARKKSAKVKKPMVLLQKLLGDGDENTPDLVNDAIQKAKYRVVVKRPIHAPIILDKPHRSWTARACRFDIYDIIQ